MRSWRKGIGGFLLAGIFVAATNSGENCDKKELVRACNEELPPFSYDSAEITRFHFTDSAQHKEVKVPQFKGERYRLAFNLSHIPESVDIHVKIFSTATLFGNRRLVFSSKDLPSGREKFVFEPEKNKTLFVRYEAEGAPKEELTGCAAFSVGYELTFVKQ